MPVLSAACTTPEQAKLSARIGVFVEEVDNIGVFVPVGCCISSFTPPNLSRPANIDPSCLNIDDCDNITTSACSDPPNTTPGAMEESVFTFETNHAPGSVRTTWFENQVKCSEKLKYMLCYSNGAKQVIDCAWVKSYVPTTADNSSTSILATVTISICGPWVYQ